MARRFCCYEFSAMEDLTYQVISSFTPTSKKHYHGVDYCFSNTDLSKDSKLTKIQQRYLISERESHCSTISTPRVQRAMKKSRRNKEAMLQAKRAASMQVGVAQGDVTKRDFELEGVWLLYVSLLSCDAILHRKYFFQTTTHPQFSNGSSNQTLHH